MRAVFIASAWILAGCLTEVEPEPDLSEVEGTIGASNKLTSNKLTSNKLTSNKLGAAVLSSSGLAASQLIETADGREVLSYIVSCALPATKGVRLTYGGVTYAFPGLMGLAPEWALRLPTVSERRWVTACLLSRTNLYGVSVPISMRSEGNPALASSYWERQTYDTTEGAFFGDLFAATPVLYACANRTWTELAGPADPAPLRACALSQDGATTQCGFTYVGLCNTWGSACGDHYSPYGSCKGGGTTYAEVITTFLRLGDIF